MRKTTCECGETLEIFVENAGSGSFILGMDCPNVDTDKCDFDSFYEWDDELECPCCGYALEELDVDDLYTDEWNYSAEVHYTKPYGHTYTIGCADCEFEYSVDTDLYTDWENGEVANVSLFGYSLENITEEDKQKLNKLWKERVEKK